MAIWAIYQVPGYCNEILLGRGVHYYFSIAQRMNIIAQTGLPYTFLRLKVTYT